MTKITGSDYGLKLSELALRLGIEYRGNGEREINGISSPEKTNPSKLCVIWEKNKIPSDKTIAIMSAGENFDEGREGLICEKPRAKLAELLGIFANTESLSGIDPKSEVSPSAEISPSAYIGAFAYVGEGCVVGDMSVIEPNAVLLRDVKVGRNCIIHSGAVIGADGFGFERTPSGLVKIPQLGGVTIGDDVEIGACTTIDRGTLSDTIIGSGTKIDNHVQIGHNVKIGSNCIICSMSGIAGSSELGDNVTMSVQAGITDHAHIGDNVIIAGRSGVTNDIPDGAIVSGFPARNHNEAKRALVLSADLPSIVKRIRILEKKCKNAEA